MSRNNSNKILFYIITVLIAWLPYFIGAWSAAKPAATTSLRSSNPEILANNTALESAIGQDHEFSTGGTNSGKHLQVTFDEPLPSAPATVAASEGVLYLLDVSNKAELHFEDEDENTVQMTSGGDLYSSTGLVVVGTSTLGGAVTANGGITLGAGDDLIGSATSDITFNTDKFTVAGATGNTLVAGTLDVQGNIDPTTYETTNGGFLDEDDMASDAADKVASQQSIKAYIANNVGSANYTPTSYAAEESVTFPNGLIIKMGVGASVGANGSKTITFGTAFPTAIKSVVVTKNGALYTAAAGAQSISASNTSAFTYANGVAQAGTFNWIAIGY